MTRKRRARVQQRIPETVWQDVELSDRREETPIVEKVHQQCPHCGSVLSRVVATDPKADGRMEYRRCKACTKPFRVWDGSFTLPRKTGGTHQSS